MATINSILNKIHKTELETHETKLALILELQLLNYLFTRSM